MCLVQVADWVRFSILFRIYILSAIPICQTCFANSKSEVQLPWYKIGRQKAQSVAHS